VTASALDLFRLDGKTALVTGASKNIGKAIAEGFADAGADVVLVARHQDALDEVAAAIRARTGRTILAKSCDVGSAEQVEAMLDDLAGRGVHIDILVNNAPALGATRKLALLETDDGPWYETFEVNVLGALRLCRRIVPAMIDAGGGTVINVISAAAFSPVVTSGPYGVSKAALWSLTQYLAREYAPTVRVNALCPGSMREEDDQRPLGRALLAATPLARGAISREAAGAAIYLASDASSFSTGDIVCANGGLSALSSYFLLDVKPRTDG
jgi:NAD(P)-dependent dehydrogenase (short-subunit alcohol dehydrogenase family)